MSESVSASGCPHAGVRTPFHRQWGEWRGLGTAQPVRLSCGLSLSLCVSQTRSLSPRGRASPSALVASPAAITQEGWELSRCPNTPAGRLSHPCRLLFPMHPVGSATHPPASQWPDLLTCPSESALLRPSLVLALWWAPGMASEHQPQAQPRAEPQ